MLKPLNFKASESIENLAEKPSENDHVILRLASNPNEIVKVPGVRRYLKAIMDESVQDSDKVVVTPDYTITKKSFMGLNQGNWINDECINGYISLINAREAGTPKSFAFNTFFFTTLQDMNQNNTYNFSKLQRYLAKKQVKLHQMNNVMFPINLKNSHWLLLNCDIPSRTIYVLDSMGCPKKLALQHVSTVRQFLQDSFVAAKSEIESPTFEYDIGEWQIKIPGNLTR